MIKRVQFFWDTSSEECLDTMINQFIFENPDLVVVDIKYQMGSLWNGKEIVTTFSALLLCEEE